MSFARLARSTFFSQLQMKPDKDNALKAMIKDIKAKHPDYGYRRVHACLPGVNHKKVQLRLILDYFAGMSANTLVNKSQ